MFLKLCRSWRVSVDERQDEPREPLPGEPSPLAGAMPDCVSSTALFEQAVRDHSRRLLAIARGIVGNRASAEDIVQQAITNLYEHRARYDWREPGGLMRRAVVNEALRLLRQPRMSMVADDHPGPSPEPVGGMLDRETVARVRAAIDRLPEHFRAALVLCEYENMAYTQIAEVLGCSVPQVKTWLHRGRRQLGRMLQEFMGVQTLEDQRLGAKRDKVV